MKHVVILSGPIGAGKTTVARELVDLSPSPTVYIEGDNFWTFFAKSGPGQTQPKNFRLMMASMTAAAVPFVRGGYDVILDFSIPPWFMESVQKILGRRNIPIDYVVLLPSVETCEARAANRPEGAVKDYASYRELYAEFESAGKHLVKDSEADPAGIAAQIKKGLEAGAFKFD